LARHVAALALTAILLATGVTVLVTRDAGDAAEPDTAQALPVEPAPPEPTPDPTVEPTAEPGPEPEPEPEPVEAPESSTQPLAARLHGLVTGLGLDGPNIGISVYDHQGRGVYQHNGSAMLLPASTQKMVVAASALIAIGPEHRLTTRVAVPALPDADGVVHGDLLLVGGGDPALSTNTFGKRVMPERPRTSIERLADRVVEAGVRRVTGHVLGDPNIFPLEPAARGWPDRYFTSLDATRVSGLTVDGGRRIRMQGGRYIGEAAANPAAEAAAALRRALEERDVVIDQGSGWTRERTTTGHEIARVGSPHMRDLLRYMVQRSDNHLAEALFKSVGLAVAQDASFAGAARSAQQTLAPIGLDWHGAVLADGSGLSREDRLSANLLAGLDVAMTRSSLGREWQELMAVSGRSGTLRRRLSGTVAEGRLRGKTGSLRDVRSLSGTVHGRDGARYHFAVIGNGLDSTSQQRVRLLSDELVLALAEDLYECVRLPALPDDGDVTETEQPPEEPDQVLLLEDYEVRCAA
jgi:serine-type D-Ala-D-Ala carboxypeptidase/endopeptidase (penicillin-binding protein 4)